MPWQRPAISDPADWIQSMLRKWLTSVWWRSQYQLITDSQVASRWKNTRKMDTSSFQTLVSNQKCTLQCLIFIFTTGWNQVRQSLPRQSRCFNSPGTIRRKLDQRHSRDSMLNLLHSNSHYSRMARKRSHLACAYLSLCILTNVEAAKFHSGAMLGEDCSKYDITPRVTVPAAVLNQVL